MFWNLLSAHFLHKFEKITCNATSNFQYSFIKTSLQSALWMLKHRSNLAVLMLLKIISATWFGTEQWARTKVLCKGLARTSSLEGNSSEVHKEYGWADDKMMWPKYFSETFSTMYQEYFLHNFQLFVTFYHPFLNFIPLLRPLYYIIIFFFLFSSFRLPPSSCLSFWISVLIYLFLSFPSSSSLSFSLIFSHFLSFHFLKFSHFLSFPPPPNTPPFISSLFFFSFSLFLSYFLFLSV